MGRHRVFKQEGLRGCQLEVVDAHASQDAVTPLEEKTNVQNARLRQADSNLINERLQQAVCCKVGGGRG